MTIPLPVKILAVAIGIMAGAAVHAHPRGAAIHAGRFHHYGHSHVRVAIGVPLFAYGRAYDPFFAPFYGPYYARRSWPLVLETLPAPVYIERGTPLTARRLWYYCDNPAGYYPYVGQCRQAWRTVNPETVPQP